MLPVAIKDSLLRVNVGSEVNSEALSRAAERCNKGEHGRLLKSAAIMQIDTALRRVLVTGWELR